MFDPRQLDSMPNDMKKHPNLFMANEMEVSSASGEWKLYWKQRVVDPHFDVLQWWERACNHMGLANLGRVALNALTPIDYDCSRGVILHHERPVDP